MELCFLASVVATGLKGIVWSHPVSAEIRVKVGNFPTPIPPKTRMKQQKDQKATLSDPRLVFLGVGGREILNHPMFPFILYTYKIATCDKAFLGEGRGVMGGRTNTVTPRKALLKSDYLLWSEAFPGTTPNYWAAHGKA